jgi:hypothetical protein
METNFRTGAERETLARLDELVVSSFSPHNGSSYSYDNNDDMDDDMDEANDEIFALPQLSRAVKYSPTNNDNHLVDSLASPLSSLDLNDDDENNRDMLHDLNNRDKKVQELIIFNKRDFENVKQSFNSSEEEWKRFLRVLYAKSEIVPDREWVDTICEFISPKNPLLSKFEELVSNNLHAETSHEEDLFEFYDTAPYQTSEIDFDGYSPPSTNSGSRRESRDDDIMRIREVDIKLIRNYPEKLADFENAYPDFFINAKICFGQECRRYINHLQEDIGNTYDFEQTNGESFDSITNEDDFMEELRADVEEHRQACEDSELYEHFVQILLAPRRMLPDDLWEKEIYECLSDWPQLMVQLKDIIAYEVSNENVKEGNFDDSQEIVVQL